MLTKGSVTIGLGTRFGPNWPGVRCGARTKAGGECKRPAVKRTGRCTRHGGKSTGLRTQAGRDKIAALKVTKKPQIGFFIFKAGWCCNSHLWSIHSSIHLSNLFIVHSHNHSCKSYLQGGGGKN